MQAKTRLSTLPAFASIPALRSGTPPRRCSHPCRKTSYFCRNSSQNHSAFSFMPATLAKLPSLATFVKTAPSLRIFYAARSASNPQPFLDKKNLDSKKNIEIQIISSAGTTGFEPVEYRHQKPGAYRLPTSQKIDYKKTNLRLRRLLLLRVRHCIRPRFYPAKPHGTQD